MKHDKTIFLNIVSQLTLTHRKVKRLVFVWSYLLLVFIPLSTAFSAVLPRLTQWPSITLPAHIQTTPLAEELIVNGLPMQVLVFSSQQPASVVVEAFKKAWGSPLVENKIDSKIILGRAHGSQHEYYLCVEIEALGQRTRGTISQTNIKRGHETYSAIQEQHQRWINRLPAASQITSDIVSQDAGILSKHLIISNQHALDINSNYLKRLLAHEGFELEKESRATHNTLITTLFFKGKNKEAMATISKNALAQTIIVLNTTEQLDNLR
ncbi:MAG: hypothetical protein V4525_11930 [Pseudomonadota bacterium]